MCVRERERVCVCVCVCVHSKLTDVAYKLDSFVKFKVQLVSVNLITLIQPSWLTGPKKEEYSVNFTVVVWRGLKFSALMLYSTTSNGYLYSTASNGYLYPTTSNGYLYSTTSTSNGYLYSSTSNE